MSTLNLDSIRPLMESLEQHPIYASIECIEDLRLLMEHHVFSVWDFMSLVKYLQGHLAPARVPWMPVGDPELRRLINQVVLEEESDSLPGSDGRTEHLSHFELYCRAMEEVGADAERPRRFLDLVRERGVDEALYSDLVPLPSRYFTETTFCFIREDKPHLVAAAFAFGREQLIPDMFSRFLERMRIAASDAPSFHYYLSRHVELDGDQHGPLSMRMLDTLCANDPVRIQEAEAAAEEALCARLRFWDGVLEAIQRRRSIQGA